MKYNNWMETIQVAVANLVNKITKKNIIDKSQSFHRIKIISSFARLNSLRIWQSINGKAIRIE